MSGTCGQAHASVRVLHVPVPGHLRVLGVPTSSLLPWYNAEFVEHDVDRELPLCHPDADLPVESVFLLFSVSIRSLSCTRLFFMASWRWKRRGGRCGLRRDPCWGSQWWNRHVLVSVCALPSSLSAAGALPVGAPLDSSVGSASHLQVRLILLVSVLIVSLPVLVLCFAMRVRMSR